MLKIILLILLTATCSLSFAQDKADEITLCDKGKAWPYYHPDLTYTGGFWEIKQHYQSAYPLDAFASLKDNSGIITIRFIVNCEGETGYFRVEQCDLDYKPTSLNQKRK